MKVSRRTLLTTSGLGLAASAAPAFAKAELPAHPNLFIGTGGTGHTYPGATLPFGMVQLSPDTGVERWENCSGYYRTDRSILGFSHTHLSGSAYSPEKSWR